MVAWPQRGSPSGDLHALADLADLADLAPTLPHVPGLPLRRRARLRVAPPTAQPVARPAYAPVTGRQAETLADFAAFMLCRRPEQLFSATVLEHITASELAAIYRILRSVYEPALVLAGRAAVVP